MLLQSHAGVLHLLPALPAAWPSGSISGLRARGNFGVSIVWKNGSLCEAIIESGSGEVCALRYGAHTLSFPTKRGKTNKVVFDGADIKVQN